MNITAIDISKIQKKMKKNSLRWQKSNKEKYYASIYRWGKANPSKIQTHRRRCYKRRSNTAKGKLNNSLSSGIGHSLKYGKNGRHWEDLVGYTLASLMKHLEKQFESWMTWENYGKKGWEIDHIIPVTVFNYETPDDLDFKRCWALKNLRPMEAIENIIKSNKLTEHFQPSLLMNCNKET